MQNWGSGRWRKGHFARYWWTDAKMIRAITVYIQKFEKSYNIASAGGSERDWILPFIKTDDAEISPLFMWSSARPDNQTI